MGESEIPAGQNESDRSVAGATVVHATVVHAFAHNPRLPWTPEGLASWYGLRIGLVRAALKELQARGLVRQLRSHRSDVFQWAEPQARRRSARGHRREQGLHHSGALPSARPRKAPARPRPAAAGASP